MPLFNPSAAGSTPIRGDWKPQFANNGRKGEGYDTALVSMNASASSAADGFLHMAKVWVDDPATLSALHFSVNAGGATLTAACRGFIYNTAGTLIAQTGDISTTLTSAGEKSVTLTAEAGQSLALGGTDVWVHAGLLVKGTTMPVINGIGNASGILGTHFELTDSTMWRFLRDGGGNASVPASRPAAVNLVADTGRQWWMAVS